MARPKKLHTLVAEILSREVAEAAKQLVADAVLAKLAEQGVPVEGFPIEDFLHRLESGRDLDGFKWPEGTPDKHLNMTFTTEEEVAMSNQINKMVSMLRDGEVLADLLKAPAGVILKELTKTIEEIKAYEDTEHYGFRRRLDLRWGKCLDLYRLLLRSSYELFVEMYTSLRKSTVKRHLYLREALLGIHARALRTGRAVLILLENGMADEAYTRWRTLYELSVVAEFISKHGDEVAAMYMEHEIVSNKARIDNSIDWQRPLGSKQEREDIVDEYEYLVKQYGESFGKQYGWASKFLGGNRNPRFVDLELATKGRRIPPPYKESSFQVHSGRAGLLGLGSLDGSAITTGHSNAGLDIPLMHSSLAVMQITATTLLHNPARDLVVIKMLMLLNEKIHVEANKASKMLEKDHKKGDLERSSIP